MDQREKTLRCLSSLQAVCGPSYRIVLWDNGSEDGTVEAVREVYPDVLVHHSSVNLGVASGRNAASKLAIESFDPRYLFFLDNDMVVASDFLTKLLEPFSTESQLAQTTGKICVLGDERRIYGAGGCRVRFWLGDTMHVGYGEIDRGQYDRPKRCIPSGGCMFIRTDVFVQLGGFDPLFDPYGPEDLDLGLRAVQAGYYGSYVPEAVVFHEAEPGHTFEGGSHSERYASLRAQHWVSFMRRHASPSQQIVFLLIGAPYRLARVLAREVRSGNLAAVRGLLQGGLAMLWRSIRGQRP
jgi:GT2 family glycosyltransferase